MAHEFKHPFSLKTTKLNYKQTVLNYIYRINVCHKERLHNLIAVWVEHLQESCKVVRWDEKKGAVEE